MSKKSLVFGVGINDYNAKVKTKGIHLDSYVRWKILLQRCYSKKYQASHPRYVGCVVCNEWLSYSSFKKWYDKYYIQGYDLDKDILVKGNKIYSPNTCCFVPHEINILVRDYNYKDKHFNLPTGISYDKLRKKYKSGGYFNSIQKRFDFINDAISYYNIVKKEYINKIAEEYYKSNKISEKVYIALKNY